MSSTILVVDDDLHVRRFLRTVVTGHGHTVVEAGTVAEAIDAIARVHPSIVLLDLGLPDGDGLQVLQAVPAETRPPIIVLSARGQEGDKVAALDAGAEDRAFHENKLVTARFYSERELPLAGALRRKIEAGAETLMKIPAEAF